MKQILIALALIVVQVHAGPSKGYKGTWRKLEGKIVLQEDLTFTEPAPGVEVLIEEATEFATRFTFFPNGNYYCAYNDGWNYYVCGANDGSDFFCKYYTDGSIDCDA